MRFDAAQALSEAGEMVGDRASVSYVIAKGQGASEIARAAQIAQADLIALPLSRSPRLPRLGFASLAAEERRRLRRARVLFLACGVLLVAITTLGIYH